LLPEISCYIAALAVAEAVNGLGVKTNIKWPNDILVDGKKLCGILIERHKNSLITGIGVNIDSSPEHLERNRMACSLSDYIRDIDTQKLLRDILSNFESLVAEVSRNGFEGIRNKLVSQLYRLNEPVELEYNGKKMAGIVRDINKDGSLVLESGKLLQEYRVGEIFDL
jgi:BirA family transcriptional regulator, biotin operon repressor / biotin---[acetyl-CoA-carboxylase] ligase